MLKNRIRKRSSGIFWSSFLILDTSLYKTTQFEVLSQLSARGYDAYLFANHSKNRVSVDGYRICLTSIPLRYIPVITPLMHSIVSLLYFPFFFMSKKPKYVIIEPDLSILNFFWKPLVSRLNSKMVLDVRSTPVEVVNFRRYLSSLWFRISVIISKKLFDGMTTLTVPMKQELCHQFSIPEEFIGVWTSGVSTTFFDAKKYPDSKLLRKKLSVDNKFVIIYHGSISANRGLLESLKAMAIVKTKCPNIVLFILGSGPAFSDLKKVAKEMGVQDNVVFHEPVPYEKVPEYINMADVGIIPLPNIAQWRKQSPLKLLEYLAMEKMVICTDIPANRDILGGLDCGAFISSVNPEEIADAIINVYHNSKNGAVQTEKGRLIVEEKYTWKKVADDLENFLLNLN